MLKVQGYALLPTQRVREVLRDGDELVSSTARGPSCTEANGEIKMEERERGVELDEMDVGGGLTCEGRNLRILKTQNSTALISLTHHW